MCVCVCVCVCVCIGAYMLRTYVHMYICTYIRIYTFTYTHMHIHMYIYTFLDIDSSIDINVHICIYIYIHPGRICTVRIVVSKFYSPQQNINSKLQNEVSERGSATFVSTTLPPFFLFSDAQVLCGHFIKSFCDTWRWLSTSHVDFPTSNERRWIDL